MTAHVDPDLRRFIRKEIERQIMVLLTGVSGNDDPEKWTEDIEQIYPGADTLEGRPVMHPFGFVSRTPRGTLQVVGRQGEHPSNRIVIGHRDMNRPTDLDAGTSKLYSEQGYQLYAGSDGVYVGKDAADNPLALGVPLNDFLGQLLDLLIAHVHPSPGAPSDKSADFTQLKANVVDSESILTTGDGGL
jgi:hypothetical protein